MLLPFPFRHNPIHKVQSFVNHVVIDVLCRAPKLKAKVFTSNLVLLKYQALIDDVDEELILRPLQDAFRICRTLDIASLKVIKRAVIQNNRIRELCNGTVKPILYDEIDSISEDLGKAIRAFCNQLYDKSILRAAFYNQFGKLEEYYRLLVGKSSTCRACGIRGILTKFHSKRSAFDHYLPRKSYPFSGVNFHNLVPICDVCNESYKGQTNPLIEVTDAGTVRQSSRKVKAFYPYRREIPPINVAIVLNKPYGPNLEPSDIELSISCLGFEEQVETWQRIFGIKENYLAELCSDSMYSYRSEEYNALMNHGISHERYLEMLARNKFANSNFLKIAFLEATR